jgi:hypothetical protein
LNIPPLPPTPTVAAAEDPPQPPAPKPVVPKPPPDRLHDLTGQASRICARVLLEMYSKRLRQVAWPFLEPVDHKALGLYDYKDRITRPMDLSTIREKLLQGEGMGEKKASGFVREGGRCTRIVFLFFFFFFFFFFL